MEPAPQKTYTTGELIEYAQMRTGNPALAAMAERLATLTSALESATQTNKVLAARLNIDPASNSPLAPIYRHLASIEQALEEAGLVPATPPLVYATGTQREEIERLLKHPAITRREKTRSLLNINRFSPEAAVVKIAELRKIIDKHDNTPSA